MTHTVDDARAMLWLPPAAPTPDVLGTLCRLSRTNGPVRLARRWLSHGGMFVNDEVRVEVSAAAATARLANLITGDSLIQASHQAWGEGIARVGPLPGLSRLVRVRFLEPTRQGATTTLALRWEATGLTGRMFPVLDANLIVIPDGDRATKLAFQGVYGPPGGQLGAGLDHAVLHRIAEATIRSFLTHIALVIAYPALAPEDSPRADVTDLSAGRLAPGTP